MNDLARLVRRARLQKAAVNVAAPHSSLTARSDIAANGPMFTTPNELTSGQFGDKGNLAKWLEDFVTNSRKKLTYSRMAGRQSVQRRTP